MDAPQPSARPQWHFDAAILAWLFPGLGHAWLGERRRGSILCLSIMILWTAGFLISGISVFDRVDHPMWFVGQMLLAPSVAADQVLQHKLKGPTPPLPGDVDPSYEPSFGRVSEQGILYTALAGLLNLLAILDVLYRDAHHRGNPTADDNSDAPGASGVPAASGGGAPAGGTSGSGSGGGA